MTWKLGAQLTAGDRFRLDGRWYTAAGPAGVFVLADGKPYDGLRSVPVTPGTGTHGGDTVGVLPEIAYATGGSTAVPLTLRVYRGSGDWADLVVEVTYARRKWGGWEVLLASNGRRLGWVTSGSDGDGWSAHATPEAFRGSGPDDAGHWRDDVPGYLTRELSPGEHYPVGGGKTRDDAAADLARWLHDKSAPALGFGRHPAVRPYDDPWCPGSSQKWAGVHGVAACPVCLQSAGHGPGSLYVGMPRKRGDRWDGKVPQHLKAKEHAR